MNIARKIAHKAEAVKGGAKKTAGRARRSSPRGPRGGHERAGGHAVDHEPGDHSQPAVDPRRDRCRAEDVALRGLQRRRVAVHLAPDARADRTQPGTDRGTAAPRVFPAARLQARQSRTGVGKHRGPGLMASRSACGSVQLGQDCAYGLAEGEHGRVKDSQAQGRTARTALDVAAASMARGASGIWLRAGSRLGLACRGAFIAPHRPTDIAAFYRPVGVAPGHRGQATAALSVIGGISRSHPRCLVRRHFLKPLLASPTWRPVTGRKRRPRVTHGGQPVSVGGGDSRALTLQRVGISPHSRRPPRESARVQCQPDPIAASARAAVTPAARAGSPLANRTAGSP